MTDRLAELTSPGVGNPFADSGDVGTSSPSASASSAVGGAGNPFASTSSNPFASDTANVSAVSSAPPVDVEMGVMMGVDDDDDDDEQGGAFLAAFFAQVNALKVKLSQIKTNVADMETLNGKVLSAISSDESKDAKKRLETLSSSMNGMFLGVRKELDAMAEENAKLERDGSAESRIRQNMHRQLMSTFLRHMGEYQKMQRRYQSKYREREERQIRIVNPSATKEEIDAVLSSQGGENVFAQMMLKPGVMATQTAVLEIQEKHRDIMRIEKSIHELHQLFVDMSVLVEAQGELIDSIQENVAQSKSYIRDGNKQLVKASKLQRKIRKKMCCLIVIGLAILFAMLGVFAF